MRYSKPRFVSSPPEPYVTTQSHFMVVAALSLQRSADVHALNFPCCPPIRLAAHTH